MGEIKANNWQEILSLLVRPADKPKEAKRDNKSCPLLDTVFFGNSEEDTHAHLHRLFSQFMSSFI